MCMSSCAASFHASEWPITVDTWLDFSSRQHIRSIQTVGTVGEAVLARGVRPSAMAREHSVRPIVRPSMAIHQTTSLALQRLLLRASRLVSVLPDVWHILLVQYQPPLRSASSEKAEHTAPPRRHRAEMMLKMITSCKMRPSWWPPLTWLIGTWSVSIMPVSFLHGCVFQIMRSMISPSNMMVPARCCGYVASSFGARP